MNKYARSFCFSLCLLLLAGMIVWEISLPPTEAGAARADTPNGASMDSCIHCHGPFDKLAGNVNYQAPSGERITPHRYVPHTANNAKAVPKCSNCHEPHRVPATKADLTALPKPGVHWCYTACHHENNFRSCKECHP